MARWGPGRLARATFLVVGLAFIAVTFVRTAPDARHGLLPGLPAMAASLGAVVVGQVLVSTAWVVLFPEGHDRHRLRRGFFASQLGKYVPGAVWQATGQIGFARSEQVSLAQASSRFLALTALLAASGGAVAALHAVTCAGCAGWQRAVALAGLVPAAVVHPRAMGRVTDRLYGGGRAPGARLLPAPSRLWSSLGWATLFIISNGIAYAVLLGSLDAGRSLPATVPVFAAAWTAGFLALPFPAGVGVREAVLVALIPPGSGTGAILAASLVHRLASLVGEVILIGASAVRRTPPP